MPFDRVIDFGSSFAPSERTIWGWHAARLLSVAIVMVLPALSLAGERIGDSRAAAQTEAFATCAGRFSAVAARRLAEHDPATEHAVQLEHDFDALVDAILPLALEDGIDPRRARQWRVAGWTEMAHLMRLRYSKKDTSRADRAGRDIARRLATCTRMILPG